jgi:hypothetical protein
MAEKFRFPDAKELAKLLNVSENRFHLHIKPRIKKDFSQALKTIQTFNPDIGIDENDYIVLRHPQTGKILNTDTPLNAYREE